VLVIIFFYLWQAGGLSGFFDITQRGEINLPQRVQTCQFACTSGSYTDYCVINRDIVFNEDKEDSRNGKSYTCYQLEDHSESGLGSCPNINCDVDCVGIEEQECKDTKSCEWDADEGICI